MRFTKKINQGEVIQQASRKPALRTIITSSGKNTVAER